MSNNSDTPESNRLISSRSLKDRPDNVKTYMISIPSNQKLPKKIAKYASIRQITNEKNIEDIIDNLNDIERNVSEIVNNINEINITCSSCCLSFRKSCVAKDNDTKVEIDEANLEKKEINEK